jgi:hypothetical protein
VQQACLYEHCLICQLQCCCRARVVAPMVLSIISLVNWASLPSWSTWFLLPFPSLSAYLFWEFGFVVMVLSLLAPCFLQNRAVIYYWHRMRHISLHFVQSAATSTSRYFGWVLHVPLVMFLQFWYPR